MAAGVDLIISAVCNATFCEPIYDNPALETTHSKSRAVLNTLAKEVNGAHLKIATFNNFPMSWVERQENGTHVGRGVAFTIVDILREKFNFTYEIVVPEKNFEMGGKMPEESLVGMVNVSNVDMAAAFVPKVWQYQRKVDFSTDLDEGVWIMMLKRPKESAAGSGLLAPFTSHVWYLILVAVLAYGPCITLLTRLRSKIMPEDEQPIKLSPSFWFVYGAFIKQGTNLAPEANTTRVLFTTWWLFIILLSAFYTANLTAFLTLSKFTLDIEYPKDLYKKNYRWVAAEGSAVQYIVAAPNENLYYLNAMVKNGRAEFRSFQNHSEYLPMVKNGAVLVKERDAIEHTMYADYLQKAREGVAEADRCTYVVAPNKFMAKRRGFIYPRNSKLKPLFDSILWFINQAGLVNFLKSRDLPSTKICPLDLQSKDRQLRNSDLIMTYMIMIVGLCAASAIFIGEVVVKRYVRIKFRKPADKTKEKRKKTKFNKSSTVHYYYDSKPPPYDAIFGKSKPKLLEGRQLKVVNGREYLVVEFNGGSRLVPVRTPSAFLYNLEK
ncbi:glutamate receptor ionotropic, delta-1 [Plodia interpunctella]|uniref:glutamate receptor ionotropic, delta-1 n=1 Tax=Plodia interpunctella TaxID=58824 RepID=UPI002367F58C|nr:glutamate receptor ionotropic, delta-1 [Plodia interpunctella]